MKFIAALLSPTCPRCHEGKLFQSPLKIVDRCDRCGLVLEHHDAGDGPAFFAILLVSMLIMGIAVYVEFVYQPPMWLHAALWLPLTVAGCLLTLRIAKKWLIDLEFRTGRMEGPHD